MKVNAWPCHGQCISSWEDLESNIHMSDDGDHVGTVQYSLTDSSCVEVSSLPSAVKNARIVHQNNAYGLCDGFQGIMDVAQLSITETS